MKTRYFKLFLITLLVSISCSYAQISNNVKVVRHPSELETVQIPLNCKWDYFDSEFINPSYFYDNGEDASLSEYNGKRVQLPYALEGKTGFATYHCRIENLHTDVEYSMILYKSIYGSADVFINGKCIFKSSTTSGSAETGKKSLRHIRPIIFSADKDGVVDLVIHISNYDIARGGILLVPKITTAYNMSKVVLKNIAFEAIIAGVLIMLSLYNLIIFLLNRNQKMYLYLALLSFDLIISSCTLDFSLLSYFSADWQTGLHFKIVLVSLSLIIPLYNLYAVNLYGIKFKYNWIVVLVDFLVPLYFAVYPILYTTQKVTIAMIILYFNSLYLCWLILKNSKSPKMLYTFNVVIIILMLITALYGLLIGQYESEGNSGIFLFKIAIMCFAVAQSSLAGIKRDLLSRENKNKLDQYEKFNESYKRFVPEQIISYLQVENAGGVKAGDNAICDGMILTACMRTNMESGVAIKDEKLFLLMEKYYEGIINIVKMHGGFFAKMAGKNFVIIFTEKNDNIVRCGVAIQRYVNAINAEHELKQRLLVKVDMAIHTSKIALGLVGNDKHLTTCECSSGIAEAIQICGMNKYVGSNILISEQALDYCRSYMESMFEGVIIEIHGVKTLVYKVIPFESANANIDFLPGEES